MVSEENTGNTPWRGKMAVYILSAGMVLIATSALAGIAQDLCCIVFFSTGILSLVLAAYVRFQSGKAV